jgi:hypothetical protein
MPRPLDPDLYERARRAVDRIYKKPSAFRSGAIVKLYKHLGGRYADDHRPKNLARWFKEKWQDVNPHKTKTSYPVFRPTVRVNSRTPLTVNEVNERDLVKKAKLKQKIRGERNLPPFQSKRRSSSRSVGRGRRVSKSNTVRAVRGSKGSLGLR